MKKNLIPPPKSQVSKTIGEIRILARQAIEDYRVAWDIAYERGGRGEVQVALGGHSDPTGDTVADKEQRRVALALGAVRLDEALQLMRSAQGLITGGLDPSRRKERGQWDSNSLQAQEQRSADSKKGLRLRWGRGT